jgi:hypothetical protein
MVCFQTIQKLNNRHFKILDLYLAGWTNKQIAKEVGMTETGVSVVSRSKSFQHEAAIRRKAFEEDLDEKIAEHQSEASQILQDNAANAAKTLATTLIDDGASKNLRVHAAEAILDRAGFSKQTRQEIDNSTIINLKREDLELLNETLKLEKEIIEESKPKEVVSTIQTAEENS